MLADDANRLKNLIKAKSWDVLSSRPDDTKWLINLARPFFLKTGNFADEKTGEVKEKEYVDYSYSLEQVLEIIKENRREVMKGW